MKTSTKFSSKRLYEFYQGLDKHKIENHGLLIMRDGEIIFEEYPYPYSAEMPHTMYSETKSIVSTAAGFAIDEGLFSLDSKILPFFPEYKHCESDEWENLTVRSVITMQSNKQFSFLQDMTKDYVEVFMKAPFRKNKGFFYSNNDAHLIAALVQKLSGMNLVDYLTPRLFEPLGINRPFWETDAKGDCVGGNGAHMTLRDLAKIMQCYVDGGKYNGKQVIPEWWTKEVLKKQVEFNDRPDEDGYSFFFWHDHGVVSMNGMLGQQTSYFPKYNAIVATFSCVVNDVDNNMLIKTLMPKVFEEESTEEWDNKLAEYLKTRGVKPSVCENLPEIPTGKTFYMTPVSDMLAKITFPASIVNRLLISSYARQLKGNLNEVSFELSENVLTVKWFEEGYKVVINCGLDGQPRITDCEINGNSYKIWAYAYTENGKLKAVVKLLNTLSTQYMTFDFEGDTMKLQMTGTPSFPWFICRNADQSEAVANSGFLRPVIIKGMKTFLKTVEMPMAFKAKK